MAFSFIYSLLKLLLKSVKLQLSRLEVERIMRPISRTSKGNPLQEHSGKAQKDGGTHEISHHRGWRNRPKSILPPTQNNGGGADRLSHEPYPRVCRKGTSALADS